MRAPPTKGDTVDEEDREPYDVTYMVTVTILPEQDGHPGESEIRRAIYRGIEDVNSEDCVHVERVD